MTFIYHIVKGVPESKILEMYTPFGHADFVPTIQQIQEFSLNGSTAIVSTINGDANTYFYQELAKRRKFPFFFRPFLP